MAREACKEVDGASDLQLAWAWTLRAVYILKAARWFLTTASFMNHSRLQCHPRPVPLFSSRP